MDKISVLIPIRIHTDKWKQRIYAWVVARWFLLHPAYELITSDSDIKEFSRSNARNKALAKSTGNIIVVCDADTFCSDRFLLEAIRQVKQSNTWAFPYTRYYNLTKEKTESVLLGPSNADFVDDVKPEELEFDLESVGGMQVFNRDALLEVGGWDENFNGWGYEDNSFALAAETILGPASRAEGFVCHLWHPAPEESRFGQPAIEENRSRYMRYKSYRGDVDGMKRLRITP